MARRQKGGSVLSKLKSFGSTVNSYLKRSKVLSHGAKQLGHSNLSAFLESQGYGKRKRRQKGGSVLSKLKSFVPKINELVKRSKVLSHGARNLGYNNVASFLETQGYGKRKRGRRVRGGNLRGRGFWGDFVSGFKKGFGIPLNIASSLGVPGVSQIKSVAGLVGLGDRRMDKKIMPYHRDNLVLNGGKRRKRIIRLQVRSTLPMFRNTGGALNSLSSIRRYPIRAANIVYN